jgi:predicted metal-dependent HD superfamily phosphohydrolase
MLEQLLYALCKKYTGDRNTIDILWQEISKAYNQDKRFYHNIFHIENVALQLIAVKSDISDWDAVLFAVFYHDIIYNVLKNDNEEKSAALAAERLAGLGCSKQVVAGCAALILATQNHETAMSSDVNYFIDADLSILGAEWDIYKQYADDIRKEYAEFPDAVYRPGRKKVLEHFIAMQQIFKTTYFFNRFEQTARYNLKKELQLLS